MFEKLILNMDALTDSFNLILLYMGNILS